MESSYIKWTDEQEIAFLTYRLFRYTSYLKYFGDPFIMQVPKEQMAYKDFIVALYLKMRWGLSTFPTGKLTYNFWFVKNYPPVLVSAYELTINCHRTGK